MYLMTVVCICWFKVQKISFNIIVHSVLKSLLKVPFTLHSLYIWTKFYIILIILLCMSLWFVKGRGAHIFKKSRSHLRILGARRMTWGKFCTEDPKILATTIQIVVIMATQPLGLVHLWWRVFRELTFYIFSEFIFLTYDFHFNARFVIC